MLFENLSLKLEKVLSLYDKETIINSFEKNLKTVNPQSLSLFNPLSFEIGSNINLSFMYYQPSFGDSAIEVYKNIIFKFKNTNINMNISQALNPETKLFDTTHIMIDKATEALSAGYSFVYTSLNKKICTCNAYTLEEDISFFNTIINNINHSLEDFDIVETKYRHLIDTLKEFDFHMNGNILRDI